MVLGVREVSISTAIDKPYISEYIQSACNGRTGKLEDGDIVNVDVTVYYKGVHGDLNETYFVGNVDEASKQLVRCTYECLDKAIAIGDSFSFSLVLVAIYLALCLGYVSLQLLFLNSKHMIAHLSEVFVTFIGTSRQVSAQDHRYTYQISNMSIRHKIEELRPNWILASCNDSTHGKIYQT
ncbi:hypothetical protein OsJ_23086 [Oryza sativa Japonica Group]|uniref:Peptidase M24 domain-containing protein n=1 Tax=Oryza sativa subsp. japonica TaxID=39947 RepID=B9FVH6_ORYSJ|nr:hypothetical protein OsJ_23086 [Oryza sativa Japonica Group]